jgi:flagellar hook-associated protein 2
MSTPSINLVNSVLDVGTIVDGLINVDSAPVRRMQSQVTSLQSKVSAYQSLNTRMSALANNVNTLLFGDTEAPLVQPYGFADRLSSSIFAKCSATSSDEDTVLAEASNATSGGSYSISVTSLAQAKSMASSGFADATSGLIGTGTIAITTGSGDPVTITINSTNNTLNGVRDAINNANAGVTATIINDGSTSNSYKLLIRADEMGTANAFTVTDNLTGGQALSFGQTQAALDAQFEVNGIGITKSTNTISDVIPGVTFTLKNRTTGPVTIEVDKDLDSVVNALKEFVTAYNSVSSFINGQFKYNTTTEKAGILSGDSTLRRVQGALQAQITQSVSNRFTSYGVAGQIGLEFNRDGSLTLNESDFRDALSDNFTGVAALFLGDGTPSGGATASDSRVSYGGKTLATQSGTYAVQVDTLAQQATAIGAQSVDLLAAAENLTITSGTTFANISLLQDDSIATVLSKINAAVSAKGMLITATNDGTGRIKISTNNYGSSQTFAIQSDGDGGAGTTGFGSTPVTVTGIDIAGKINGHAATGTGLTLAGMAGQPEEGLALSIAQTKTGNYGTVTVASTGAGVEGKSILMNLFSALDGITDPLSGPLHNAQDGLNKNIQMLNDQISSYQERLDKEREMLTLEYSKADQALRLMSLTQSQLSGAAISLSK